MLLPLIGCTQSFNVTEKKDLSKLIKLETKPDGTGSELNSTSILLNESITFYPVKRDSSGNYVENISVSWSLEGGIGNLNIDSSGKNATFQGSSTGTAEIKVFIDEVLFSTTTITVNSYALDLSNLQISNVTNTSFDVSVDYSGDDEANSSVSVFYCNKTDSPACDPSAGSSVDLVRGSSRWTGSVGSLSSGDIYKIMISASDTDGVNGLPLTSEQDLLGTAITISNFSVTNFSSSGFDASIDFSGDTEANSDITLYYCNRTTNSSCDPVTDGDSVAMVRGASTYTVSVSSLTAGFSYNQGDDIALSVVASDEDGVSGSPMTTTGNLSDLKLSNFKVSLATKSGFKAEVDVEEQNTNGSVTLYYCNETDSPGCDPLAGDSKAMARNGSKFETTVTGLSSPYDEGDEVTAMAVGSDPEGAYNPSGLNKTFRLADILLKNMLIGLITQDSFSLKVYKDSNGDDDGDGSGTVYYCNETASPGCDPKTGVSTAISNFGSCGSSSCDYELDITNVSATASPGETINLLVEFIDPDGIWKQDFGGGSPATYSLNLKVPNPKDIYRSVGPGQTTALADGVSDSTTLTISSGGAASFSNLLSDNIGVGDAVFYDSNADTVIDALAFIQQRTDSKTFTLRDKDGNVPVTAVSHSNWRLYRAYTSASDAENGIENPGIVADDDLVALNNFDSWTDGKDISAQTGADQNWYIALYAGVQADTKPVVVSDDWVKDFYQDLEFFVPYKSQHVGLSQKHNGVWDNTKYRLEVTDENGIYTTYIRRVNIKGLQIELKGSAASKAGIDINNNSQGVISNNIIKSSSTGTQLNGIEIYTYGGVVADEKYYDYDTSWAVLANNIIYNFNTTDSSGIGIQFQGNNGNGARIYNNTLYNNYFGVFSKAYRSSFLRNNIVMGSVHADFNSAEDQMSVHYANNNLSSDDTILNYNTSSSTGNITMQLPGDVFLDYLNQDFRLKSGSTAIGQGYDTSGLVSEDIQGETRSLPYDIGADEY